LRARRQAGQAEQNRDECYASSKNCVPFVHKEV